MLQTAIKAARSAGQIITDNAANLASLQIEQKSPNDFVSEVDRHAELAIVETILSTFPNHTIVGEEYGSQGDQQSDYHWLIDPLDGTTNFLHAIAHYAVSIAVLHKQTLLHSVVYDPIKNELFTASMGQGAFLNDEQINVKLYKQQGGLYATGIPFNGKNLDNIDSFTQTMQSVLASQTSGIRRMGAAALDLAYVAAGRFDGFWEAGLKPWDIAAGALLVKEAGGVISDFSAGDDYLKSGNMIAANDYRTHQSLYEIIRLNY